MRFTLFLSAAIIAEAIRPEMFKEKDMLIVMGIFTFLMDVTEFIFK